MNNSLKNRRVAISMSLAFMVICLILELLPNSIIMGFSVVSETGEIGKTYVGYNFFSLTPIGYAYFTPLLSAVITIAMVGIMIFREFKPYKLMTLPTILALVGGLISVLNPLMQADSKAVTPSCIFVASLMFMTFIMNLLDSLLRNKELKERYGQ